MRTVPVSRTSRCRTYITPSFPVVTVNVVAIATGVVTPTFTRTIGAPGCSPRIRSRYCGAVPRSHSVVNDADAIRIRERSTALTRSRALRRSQHGHRILCPGATVDSTAAIAVVRLQVVTDSVHDSGPLRQHPRSGIRHLSECVTAPVPEAQRAVPAPSRAPSPCQRRAPRRHAAPRGRYRRAH